MILVNDTNFASQANASAAGAGQQLGATSYIALQAATFSIASGQLVANVATGTFSTNWLVLPASMECLSGQVSVYLVAGDPVPIVLRRVTASSTTAYGGFFDNSGRLAIGTFVNGTFSTIASQSGAFTWSSGTAYILTFADAGQSPTTLTVSVATQAAPSTILATLTTTDSTSSLQGSGTFGFTSTNGVHYVNEIKAFSTVAINLPPINAVWHGDSLTYGVNGTGAGTTNATRISTAVGGLGAIITTVSNQGTAGHTLSQMIAELSNINALYNASKINVLMVQGGHNDFLAGSTTAQVISEIQTYLSTVLAVHPWSVVWSTELPAAYPGYPSNFDTLRDTVNTWLRANWRLTKISALSDVAGDYRLGPDGSEYNATYYSSSDNTHLTDPGYAIWGQYDLGAMQLAVTGAAAAAGITPNGTDVRSGVTTGGAVGSLVVPAASDVRSGTHFDNGSVGTLATSGGGGGASNAAVRSSTGVFKSN